MGSKFKVGGKAESGMKVDIYIYIYGPLLNAGVGMFKRR